MTMVSETKHVQVFKINTKLNKMKHMSFRLYPKTDQCRRHRLRRYQLE